MNFLAAAATSGIGIPAKRPAIAAIFIAMRACLIHGNACVTHFFGNFSGKPILLLDGATFKLTGSTKYSRTVVFNHLWGSKKNRRFVCEMSGKKINKCGTLVFTSFRTSEIKLNVLSNRASSLWIAEVRRVSVSCKSCKVNSCETKNSASKTPSISVPALNCSFRSSGNGTKSRRNNSLALINSLFLASCSISSNFLLQSPFDQVHNFLNSLVVIFWLTSTLNRGWPNINS